MHTILTQASRYLSTLGPLVAAGLVQAAPTVSITSPANNTVFSAPANVTINASAAPSAGTSIKRVAFYRGTTLIGTDTTAPYSVTWSNAATGTYSLTAKATDNKNRTTTSTAVTIVVNTAPTVSLTAPATNTIFNAPATITLTANAADSDSTVSKVDFYQGATLIGTATASPYTVNWSNAPAGNYSLTAKATDNNGSATTSAAVPIIVNAPPAVSLTSPTANQIFAVPATVTLTAMAADSDGAVSKVDFFQGATLIGTATAAPYTTTWYNAPVGNYTLTAKATDNRGAVTTSADLSIGVASPPTVSLTAPASNTVFAAPATITLTATAADSDGTVSKVDFYQGTALIGTATAAPYTVTWNDAPKGSYSLTAKATDNSGAVTTSAAVSITVTAGVSVYFIHTDHLNTPRLLANESNVTIWRNLPLSEPFDMTPPEEDPDGNGVPYTLNLRFPGQYFDKETDLNYNYYRDYNPATGRYLQSDPIGLQGGINTYGYVRGNPLSYTDSSGLIVDTIWDIGNLIYDIWNGNWGDAAADAAAMCIPGVPAGITKLKKLPFTKGGPPRDSKTGNYLPDPNAAGPHTTLGTRSGRNGDYTQGATFDGNGNFQGRTDVTNHGRGDHTNPHWHPATGPNSVGSAQPIPPR